MIPIRYLFIGKQRRLNCQENLVEIVRVLGLVVLISGMNDDDSPHPRPLSKVERGDSPHPPPTLRQLRRAGQPLSKVERGDSEHPSSVERGAGVVTVETGLPPELLKNARRLRKNQTEAEHIMWKALRNRKLNNWKFRRQHPISEGFILDFYCAETKIAVELDGAHHRLKDQMEYDENRTEFLEELGIRIIRILNEEVLSSKENVLAEDHCLHKLSSHESYINSPSPSPRLHLSISPSPSMERGAGG